MNRPGARLLSVAAASLLAALVAAPIAAAAEDSDIGISVTTTTAPTEGTGGTGGTGGGTDGTGSTSGGTGTGGVRSGTSGTGTGSGTSAVSSPSGTAPLGSEAATPVDEFDLGGVLYVSGLRTVARPSLNPLAGDLEVTFTVRNASTETISGDAKFWMDGFLGNSIGEPVEFDVPKIEPDETRTVRATLGGVGQWTFLTAHAEFTPPGTVDGIEISAVTRDGGVLALPWFVVMLLLIVAATFAVRYVRGAFAGRSAVAEPA
jgi:hypothetical protein